MLFYEQQHPLDIHIIPIHIMTVTFVSICQIGISQISSFSYTKNWFIVVWQKENNFQFQVREKWSIVGLQAHLRENDNLLLWRAPMKKKGIILMKHAP